MKPIPDFPNYFITKSGDVISTKRNRIRKLKPNIIYNGYKAVALCKNNRVYRKLVHRLVLIAFIGYCPNGKECRHLDGNNQNNKLDNLRWGTRYENQMDRKLHGTFVFSHGEEHYMSKLTESQVKEIRKLSKERYRQREIAEIFSICRQTVSQIVLRKSWKHIKSED